MKLTPENYYSKEANRVYMSVSQFKDFDSCEAAALAKLGDGYEEAEQVCFTLGSYVHAGIEGTDAKAAFIEQHPEIISSKGATKGELKAEYKNANTMIDAVLSDPLCRQMLEGEKEIIVTADLFGVSWKAKIDVLNVEAGRLIDVKTVKGIRERYWNDETRTWESFIEHFKYTLQMAVYSELERLHNRRFDRLEPLIVAVSKEDVPDREIICFDDETLHAELLKVQEKLPRIVAVKEGIEEPRRCEKCRYCRQTKQAKIVHYSSLLEVV